MNKPATTIASGPERVQGAGQHVATHHHRQGDHHLGFVVVDGAGELVGDVAQREAKPHPADHLFGKQQPHLTHRGVLDALLRDAVDGQEDDHAHAVVEQRFAHNFGFQLLRGIGLLEDAQHRNGVGGRDGARQRVGSG